MLDPGDFTPAYDAALCQGLAAAGHEVRLFGMAGTPASENGAKRQDWFYRGLRSPWLQGVPDGLRRAIKGGHHVIDCARLLRRGLSDFPADLVHVQWLPLPMADGIFLALQRARTPIVLTVHDSNPFNGAIAGPMRWGLGGAIRCADAVIVHTRQAVQRLEAKGVPAERLHLMPHGLLHAPPSAMPAEHAKDGLLRLLQFGKIRPYKGLDVLLASLASLREAERARVRLHVVGRPYMDMAPVMDFVRQHDLARTVEFRLDYVADAEIGHLFAATDAAVFPYREIDASGAAMSAMAHGVPVLATAIGGFAELFEDGREARLVPPDRPDRIAAVLRAWLNGADELPRLRNGMIRRRGEILSWLQIAGRTLEIYDQAWGAWLVRGGRGQAAYARPRREALP